jgi:AcrR family transcriptional regulator
LRWSQSIDLKATSLVISSNGGRPAPDDRQVPVIALAPLRLVRSYADAAERVPLSHERQDGNESNVANELTTAQRLADAAMAVIAREGHDALSVRKVAREVSVTGGTVQHHFPTKVELTVAALDRCIERQGARLLRNPRSEPAVRDMSRRLSSLLPFDGERRTEAVVWIAMSAAVSGTVEIEARHRIAVEGMRQWIRSGIVRTQRSGEVPDRVDVHDAAQMIEAGLDGMMLAGIAEAPNWNRRARQRFDVLVQRVLLVPESA